MWEGRSKNFLWAAFFIGALTLFIQLFQAGSIVWIPIFLLSILLSYQFLQNNFSKIIFVLGLSFVILVQSFPKWVIFVTSLHRDFVVDEHQNLLSLQRFLEHSLVILTPLLLMFWPRRSFGFLSKMLISLTFVAHGLFALGLPNGTPDHFYGMLSVCLPFLGEQGAVIFLRIAGAMDIVVVVLMWTSGRWRKFALLYMSIWGFLTAFARPWSSPSAWYLSLDTIYPWLEMSQRLPHALVPFSLYHWYKEVNGYSS